MNRWTIAKVDKTRKQVESERHHNACSQNQAVNADNALQDEASDAMPYSKRGIQYVTKRNARSNAKQTSTDAG